MGRFCGQCGKELEAGCKFCGNCGAPVEQDISEESQHDTLKTDTSDGKQEAQNNDNGADLKDSITEQKDKVAKLIKNHNQGNFTKYIVGVVVLLVIYYFFSGASNYAQYKVSASQLATEAFGSMYGPWDMNRDIEKAQTKYDNKTIAITGNVLSVTTYSDSPIIIVYMFDREKNGMSATIMIEVDNATAKKIKAGDVVTLVGTTKFIGHTRDGDYRITLKDGKLVD